MAFDPVSAAITGGLTLMDMEQKGRANQQAGQALDFQKRNAADMMRFAKAGRTDAFGNRTTFDDALNEWITQLTPEQKNLVLAGEREQRLGLTEDASRNRMVALRNYARGQRADDVLNREITAYDTTDPNEGAIQNQISRLMTQARGTGERDFSRVLDRQQRRQSGNVPVITRNDNSGDGAGEQYAQDALKARTAALGEVGQRQGQRAQRLSGATQNLAPMASGGSFTSQARLPTTAQDVGGREERMMQSIIQAQQAGAAGVGGAYSQLLKMPQVGMKDIAATYAALRGNQKTGGKGPTNVGSATSFGGEEDPFAAAYPDLLMG